MILKNGGSNGKETPREPRDITSHGLFASKTILQSQGHRPSRWPASVFRGSNSLFTSQCLQNRANIRLNLLVDFLPYVF